MFIWSHSLSSEEELDIFPKSGRVVVLGSLGVSEALQQGRGLEDLLGDQVGRRLVHGGQVLHDELRALRLACPRLAGDDHDLVLGVFVHLAVRGRADREQVPDGREVKNEPFRKKN